MKSYCDSLTSVVSLRKPPERVVSLVPGFTETLVELGYEHLLAGITNYCLRFRPHLKAPVVGDYLKVDTCRLSKVDPDIILATTGIQRPLVEKLLKKGFPVWALPLPKSLHGILDNVLTLGALLNDLRAARDLVGRWEMVFAGLKRDIPWPRPRIYVELWLGRHVRMVGGLTFINDLIEVAGGVNIFADDPKGYLRLNLKEVERRRPDIFVCFSEPELPRQALDLQQERGWHYKILQADVDPSHNLIHDGPSMMEAAKWLHRSIWALWRG